MTREDWMANQADKPVFGDLITRPPGDAIRYQIERFANGAGFLCG